MKRFTTIMALVLMIAMPTFAERVTPETAQKVAKTFLSNNGAKTAQLSDISKASGFSNLYVFAGEQGFVVMAADDCVQPILGYSLTGNFVAENMPTNVSGWLQGYNDEIQYAIDNQMRATAETAKLWKELTEGNSKAGMAATVVNNLLLTTWDQDPGYNDLCPNDNSTGQLTVTGCVATAMAQIMKYWEYPNHGVGSHSYTPETHPEYGLQSVDYGSTTYDWASMPLSQPNTEVAKLMYHCGVSVDMDYDIASNGGSGAVTAYVAYALQTYFNYQPCTFRNKDDYTNIEWVGMLKAELDAQRPLQYSGRGSGGHSFVCCGYDNSDRFYFNWGWSGRNDGFYELTNLVPGSGGSGGGNYNYTHSQGAIFGIQPVQCDAEEPSNLTYTLSGIQNLTLNWTAAGGAVSYNIYRNGHYVGNSTTNSYSETTPFGNNVYYVRCVDANGNLSLSSNTVIVYIGYQTPIVNDLEASLSENNVNLTWSAPEWSYPETPSATLNYGTGNLFYSWTSVYYAHRHLAANLAQYAGKAVYKVSTFIQYPGTYSIYIYTKSTQYNQPDPNYLAFSKVGVPVSISDEMFEFNTNEPIILTGADDLWVVIRHENTGQQFPTPSFNLSEHNTNAFYASNSSPTSLFDANPSYNCSWFISTYLTDGAYTYNLYQDGTQIAEDLGQTTYNATLNNNAANLFSVKTNYYGGETEESNKIGFAKGNATLTALGLSENDQMTITENSKLTVSGTLSDVSSSNLILENGAQLVNSSTGVQATVKKSITAYSQDGGWNFLASPILESITPTVDNGLLANNYDLYTFDQSEELEWRNIKASTFTTIDNKTGYLYANNGNPSLSFEGTLVTNTTATSLAYDNNAEFKGLNFIGNPYPCNTYIDKSFYVLDGDGSDFSLGSNPIPPCAAILVQAQGAGDTVTFSKTASKNKPGIIATVKTMQGKVEKIIDKARVSFEESDNLTKFTLGHCHTQLYIPQDKQNYAVAFVNGQREMPLNFKAGKNGTYILDFKVENMETNYLHLIDNKTGIDVDLLATPSYVFEATTNDHEARFRLALPPICEDANGGNETFAYYANGEIHLVETQNFASLQIVDMTGRILVNRDMVRHISTANIAPGTYFLRLISGEQVKTQKIVLQ